MRYTACKICYYLIVIKKDKNKTKNNFLYQGGYIMKLSSKVFAGTLASAGMVLSLVAPALTAQAAQTTGKVNDDGTVEKVDGFPATADASKNGGLAIAYDAGDGSTVGTASMDSNANVKVADGVLILDAVPDFGFGTAAIGSKVNLQDNNYDTKEEDSNNNDAVKIIESRKQAGGFQLDAAITGFSAEGVDKVQPFTLTLGKTALVDGDGNNVTTASTGNAANDALETTEQSITGKDDGSLGTPGTIADLDKGSYKTGVINASFAPSDKNVSLDLSKGTTIDGTTPSVKSYNAKITWTLTAKPIDKASTTEP